MAYRNEVVEGIKITYLHIDRKEASYTDDISLAEFDIVLIEENGPRGKEIGKIKEKRM